VDRNTNRGFSGRARTAAWLAALVLIGTVVRMAPWFQDPGLDLASDASYHERLVIALIQNGRLPSPDPLSEAPLGRRIGPLLPEGLYVLAAGFCRAVGAIDPSRIHVALMWFTALAGALVALPTYLAARALYPGSAAAAIAAIAVTLMPAHIHRTVAYWLRYDALGTLFVTTHLALAFMALDPQASRRRLAALGSALALAAAVAVWRVPLMIPLIETVFVVAWVIARGASPALREWFALTVLIGSLSFPALEYLRAQSYLLSPVWLASVAVAVVLFLPALSEGGRAAIRAPALAIALGAGWAVGHALAPPSPYSGALDLLMFKLRARLHLGAVARPRGLEALLIEVQELYGLTPGALLIGPQQFFLLGPWCLAAPWVIRGFGPAGARRGLSAPHALMAFMSVVLALFTLLMNRNKVLLAPLVAVIAGGLFEALRPRRNAEAAPAARERRPRDARRPRASRAPGARAIVFGVFLLSLASTLVCGILLATSRRSHLPPGFAACAAWLKSHATAGAIVFAPAEYGYDLQAHAGCASLTDGLLESPENQRRILATYSAWFANDDRGLIEICRRDSVQYVLVPPGDQLYGIAFVTAEPFVPRLEAGLPLDSLDLERPLMRMMLGRFASPNFTQLFESESFRIYRTPLARGL